MLDRDAILGISISLEVAEQLLLFLYLGDDGAVQRMGNGERNQGELRLYTGSSPHRLFESLMGHIDDEVLQAVGEYALPDPKGDPCRLQILFKGTNDRTSRFEFSYGAESEGPPMEILDLVINALDLTEHWYNDERRRDGTLVDRDEEDDGDDEVDFDFNSGSKPRAKP